MKVRLPIINIKNLFHSLAKKNSSFFRYDSKPFVSGDTFRKLCQNIYDETKKTDPLRVLKNDIVFLKTDLVEEYFETFHPYVQNNYNLITHNSDNSITSNHAKFKDEKINNWFAQNLDINSANNIYPLPIGLENRRYFNNGQIGLFKNTKKINKNDKILSSFNTNTNPDERIPLKKIIKDTPFVTQFSSSSQKKYIENVNLHKYILCPSGNGLDSHRVWETLLLGSIPVLKKSYFSINFKDLGVPMILLNDWKDLNNLTESYLKNYFDEIVSKKQIQYYGSYSFWYKFIKSKI